MAWLHKTRLQPWMLLQRSSLMPGSSARCLQISIIVATVNIPRYNRIHWPQSCPGKETAGGCPYAPCSGARPLPLPAPARGAGAAPTSLCWWRPPKLSGQPKARVKARRRTPKQSKTLKLEVRNSSRTWIEAWGSRPGRKQALKPEARVEALSALQRRKRSNLGCRRYCRLQMSRP